ncbi:hypothetical protein RB195_010954 [Necator americanus]|uniref:GATA-type domain-containing protein n=1 Tax=Necator americanus TaxID=51031 RepID=A0ABR1D1Z2_NECAM
MYSGTLNSRYYTDPCCSTTTIQDTMCDTTYHFDGIQQHVPSDVYDPRRVDTDMDSLMQTLQENPDFFDPAAYCIPMSSMTQFHSTHDAYGSIQSQQLFGTMHYEPSGRTVQTPLSSPDPPPGTTSVQFEEFSLATQLPVLNSCKGTYATIEPTAAAVNSANLQNIEPYSAQYFFTTPPDTPPGALPLAPLAGLPNPCSRLPSSNSDPTPTIRKLLQQKKKRMPAVPCHVNSVCTTCKTRTTSLWRRNHFGEIECNACNLYFRKNNCKRPATLRKDEIMKRKRKPRIDSSHSAEVGSSGNVDAGQAQPAQKLFPFT